MQLHYLGNNCYRPFDDKLAPFAQVVLAALDAVPTEELARDGTGKRLWTFVWKLIGPTHGLVPGEFAWSCPGSSCNARWPAASASTSTLDANRCCSG